MIAGDNHLRRLLASDLPLDAVGPTLRRAARQALASGDSERMRRVATAVVAELLRRGDLIRVAVEGSATLGRSFHLVRGRTRLLDLSAVLPGGAETPIQARPQPPAEPTHESREPGAPPAAEGDGTIWDDPSSLRRLLAAMEHAQNLQVGAPLSTHRQVVLEEILAMLERALPAFRFFVELLDEGDPQVPSHRVYAAPAGGPVPIWAGQRSPGTSVWIESPAELPARLQDALASAPFATGVAVPLVAPPPLGQVAAESAEAGLLYLLPTRPWRRGALLQFGRQLSRFVTRRWRRQREVSLLVHTDSLTGVHNRAYFDEQIGLELERAKRHESPLALVLADIDHFKEVNDRYGHQVGDAVLRAVARELQGGLRRIDMVARVGGEEFALLLPDTVAAAAQEVCLRLLERLDRARIAAPGASEPLQVTLSFGGVTFPEGGIDPAELYRKADGMLYLSKRGGRNRCTFWNPAGDPLTLLPPTVPPH